MIVDLFAGPRGWSEGLTQLGLADVGLELDADACRTAVNAGHQTIRCDVGNYPTAPFSDVAGLIASPPCPAFSAAGTGKGRDLLASIVAAVHAERWDALRDAGPEVWLTLDVGRWLTDLHPVWVAFEQVPAVLPIWEAFAHVLRGRGYSTWCGVLSAETFGVPQTRRRAVLIASRRAAVSAPAPTHQRYEPGIKQGDAEACSSLFGCVAPWVSMADALAWGLADRPAPTVSAGGSRSGGAEPFANRALRVRISESTKPSEITLHTNRGQDEFGDRQTVSVTRPAPTLTATNTGWCFVRPATTVLCDPRLAPPGHKDRENGEPQFGPGTVRLTPEMALVLQSFRRDYPVHGTKTSQLRQIGNAVPPLLAAAVLREATR